MNTHQGWVHKGMSAAKSAFEAKDTQTCREAFDELWEDSAAHALDRTRSYEQFRSGWLNYVHDVQQTQPNVELWPGAFDV